jgi:hypothetical protein
MRLSALLLATALTASPANAGRKPKPPPPAPALATCDDFEGCLTALGTAFEATDFEKAQRLARLAETFAQAPAQRARLLVLSGALDVQALGLADPAIAEAVTSRFEQALKLDRGLTSMAIPAYARTEALEALWRAAEVRARPPPVLTPKVEVRPAAAEPVVVAPPPPRRFPVAPVVLGGLAAAAGGTGLGFGLASGASLKLRDLAPTDATGWGYQVQAQQQALYANVAFAVAGAAVLAAVLTWLLSS